MAAASDKRKPRTRRSTRESSHGSARGPQDAGVKRRRRPRRSAAIIPIACPELVLMLRKYWNVATPMGRQDAIYRLRGVEQLHTETGPAIQAALLDLEAATMCLNMPPNAAIQMLLVYEARYDLSTLQRVARDLLTQFESFAAADLAAGADAKRNK